MKIEHYLSLSLILLGGIFFSCTRFETPKITMSAVTVEKDSSVYFCAWITDGGGANIFNKKGYCYSNKTNFDRVSDSTTTVLDYYSQRKQWVFEWYDKYWKQDTIYYKAWVQTNAGIGYSNIVEIVIDSTFLPKVIFYN